jgi:RimJ/RimL family protein N-acetyltransferase
MECRKIYTSDSDYILCRLSIEDKDDYMNLLQEINTIPHFYEDKMKSDIMWKIAINGNCDFSIFNNEWEYCGNIMLKYPEAEHPEIGIDILSKFRNQGIGPRVIKLFARKVYEKRKVEYFIVRAYAYNAHSIHVIEKLGAIPDNSEDIFINSVINTLKKNMSEDEAREEAEKIFNNDNHKVYQYRYMPEMFLNNE